MSLGDPFAQEHCFGDAEIGDSLVSSLGFASDSVLKHFIVELEFPVCLDRIPFEHIAHDLPVLPVICDSLDPGRLNQLSLNWHVLLVIEAIL